MSKILRLLNIGEFNSLKNSLPLVAGMMDNNATTKLQAVKPNRHSLAIFIPKIIFSLKVLRFLYLLYQKLLLAVHPPWLFLYFTKNEEFSVKN